MRLKKYCLVSLGLWCILNYSGCTSITQPVGHHGTLPYALTPKIVLGKITKPNQDIVKAIANIEVNHASERYFTKAAILLKKPSSLRVEVIPVIGPVSFFLSVHKDVMKAFLPQKGSYYIGKATPENISRIVNFLPAGLSIEDVLSFMLGTYPCMNEENLSLRGSEEGNFYRVDMMTEGRKVQSLLVDISNERLVRVEVFKNCDSPLYTAMFEEFDKTGQLAIPMKITIASETDDHQKVIIRYSSMQPSAEIDYSAFDLQIPTGISPVRIE